MNKNERVDIQQYHYQNKKNFEYCHNKHEYIYLHEDIDLRRIDPVRHHPLYIQNMILLLQTIYQHIQFYIDY